MASADVAGPARPQNLVGRVRARTLIGNTAVIRSAENQGKCTATPIVCDLLELISAASIDGVADLLTYRARPRVPLGNGFALVRERIQLLPGRAYGGRHLAGPDEAPCREIQSSRCLRNSICLCAAVNTPLPYLYADVLIVRDTECGAITVGWCIRPSRRAIICWVIIWIPGVYLDRVAFRSPKGLGTAFCRGSIVRDACVQTSRGVNGISVNPRRVIGLRGRRISVRKRSTCEREEYAKPGDQ